MHTVGDFAKQVVSFKERREAVKKEQSFSAAVAKWVAQKKEPLGEAVHLPALTVKTDEEEPAGVVAMEEVPSAPSCTSAPPSSVTSGLPRVDSFSSTVSSADLPTRGALSSAASDCSAGGLDPAPPLSLHLSLSNESSKSSVGGPSKGDSGDDEWSPCSVASESQHRAASKAEASKAKAAFLSALNRLSRDNYGTISHLLFSHKVKSFAAYKAIVGQVFEAALLIPTFQDLFARLVNDLSLAAYQWQACFSSVQLLEQCPKGKGFYQVIEDAEEGEGLKGPFDTHEQAAKDLANKLSFKHLVREQCEKCFMDRSAQEGLTKEEAEDAHALSQGSLSQERAAERAYERREARAAAKGRVHNSLRFMGHLYLAPPSTTSATSGSAPATATPTEGACGGQFSRLRDSLLPPPAPTACAPKPVHIPTEEALTKAVTYKYLVDILTRLFHSGKVTEVDEEDVECVNVFLPLVGRALAAEDNQATKPFLPKVLKALKDIDSSPARPLRVRFTCQAMLDQAGKGWLEPPSAGTTVNTSISISTSTSASTSKAGGFGGGIKFSQYVEELTRPIAPRPASAAPARPLTADVRSRARVGGGAGAFSSGGLFSSPLSRSSVAPLAKPSSGYASGGGGGGFSGEGEGGGSSVAGGWVTVGMRTGCPAVGKTTLSTFAGSANTKLEIKENLREEDADWAEWVKERVDKWMEDLSAWQLDTGSTPPGLTVEHSAVEGARVAYPYLILPPANPFRRKLLNKLVNERWGNTWKETVVKGSVLIVKRPSDKPLSAAENEDPQRLVWVGSGTAGLEAFERWNQTSASSPSTPSTLSTAGVTEELKKGYCFMVHPKAWGEDDIKQFSLEKAGVQLHKAALPEPHDQLGLEGTGTCRSRVKVATPGPKSRWDAVEKEGLRKLCAFAHTDLKVRFHTALPAPSRAPAPAPALVCAAPAARAASTLPPAISTPPTVQGSRLAREATNLFEEFVSNGGLQGNEDTFSELAQGARDFLKGSPAAAGTALILAALRDRKAGPPALACLLKAGGLLTPAHALSACQEFFSPAQGHQDVTPTGMNFHGIESSWLADHCIAILRPLVAAGLLPLAGLAPVLTGIASSASSTHLTASGGYILAALGGGVSEPHQLLACTAPGPVALAAGSAKAECRLSAALAAVPPGGADSSHLEPLRAALALRSSLLSLALSTGGQGGGEEVERGVAAFLASPLAQESPAARRDFARVLVGEAGAAAAFLQFDSAEGTAEEAVERCRGVLGPAVSAMAGGGTQSLTEALQLAAGSGEWPLGDTPEAVAQALVHAFSSLLEA